MEGTLDRDALRSRFEEHLKDAPAIIPRPMAGSLMEGFVSKGYLRNLDAKGLGPKSVKIGRRVGYFKKDFVDWLVERSG